MRRTQMLCYVTLRYVMLFYVMLCCVVLCCVMFKMLNVHVAEPRADWRECGTT